MSISTPQPAFKTNTQQSIADRVWSLIYGDWQGSPKRASRMSKSASGRKYSDIRDYSLTRDDLADHLTGSVTYAATLGAAGYAWAGCKDYDSASEDEITHALAVAAQKGIIAVAIQITDPASGENTDEHTDEHTGGHIWAFYDRAYPVNDIRARLRTIPRAGKGEDYPSGNPIRLPFGKHQIKGTCGVLRFQDGRRFNLDIPAEREAGFDALLTLPRNGKPEPAPIGDARVSGAAWGEAFKPEHWKNLPDGGPLWRSPYVATIAARPDPEGRREPLRAILRGERAVIRCADDTLDDSDSAQIAGFIFGLLSGDVCEPQVRSIALYLRSKLNLRPDKTLDHYKAHIDREIEKYRPKHYGPQVIRILGPADDAPLSLPVAQHKPERKYKRGRPYTLTAQDAFMRLAALHDNGLITHTVQACADMLNVSRSTMERYERAWRKDGLIQRITPAARQYSYIELTEEGLSYYERRSETCVQGRHQDTTADRQGIESYSQTSGEDGAPASAPGASLPKRGWESNLHPSAGTRSDTPIAIGPFIITGSGSAHEVPSSDAPAPQQDAENKPNAVQVEHPPPLAPAPTLAEAVAEAFDAYAARPLITGKGGKPRRMPLRKRTIVAYVTSNYPALVVGDDKLDRAIQQERIVRQRLQRDACETAKARKMSLADLRRKSRSLATQAAAIDRACKEGVELPPILTFEVNGKQYRTKAPRHPTPAQAAVLRHLAGIYAAEESRRAPPDEPTMHELWAQVDKAAYVQARRELGIGTGAAPKRGSVLPLTGTVEPLALGEPGASVYDPVGLVDRLKKVRKGAV